MAGEFHYKCINFKAMLGNCLLVAEKCLFQQNIICKHFDMNKWHQNSTSVALSLKPMLISQPQIYGVLGATTSLFAYSMTHTRVIKCPSQYLMKQRNVCTVTHSLHYYLPGGFITSDNTWNQWRSSHVLSGYMNRPCNCHELHTS